MIMVIIFVRNNNPLAFLNWNDNQLNNFDWIENQINYYYGQFVGFVEVANVGNPNPSLAPPIVVLAIK